MGSRMTKSIKITFNIIGDKAPSFEGEYSGTQPVIILVYLQSLMPFVEKGV